MTEKSKNKMPRGFRRQLPMEWLSARALKSLILSFLIQALNKYSVRVSLVQGTDR